MMHNAILRNQLKNGQFIEKHKSVGTHTSLHIGTLKTFRSFILLLASQPCLQQNPLISRIFDVPFMQ